MRDCGFRAPGLAHQCVADAIVGDFSRGPETAEGGILKGGLGYGDLGEVGEGMGWYGLLVLDLNLDALLRHVR